MALAKRPVVFQSSRKNYYWESKKLYLVKRFKSCLILTLKFSFNLTNTGLDNSLAKHSLVRDRLSLGFAWIIATMAMFRLILIM